MNIRELSFVSQEPITSLPYTRYSIQLNQDMGEDSTLAKEIGRLASRLKYQHGRPILADFSHSALLSPIPLAQETETYTVLQQEEINLGEPHYQRFLFQVCNFALTEAFQQAKSRPKVDYYRKRIYSSKVNRHDKYEVQPYLMFDFLRDRNNYLILVIDFANEYRSRETIYQLGRKQLTQGDRLIHTYDGKGCQFVEVGETTIATPLVELGNRSVLQYHQGKDYFPAELRQSLKLNTPVVKVVYKSQKKKDFAAYHMPQLLKKIYDRTEIEQNFFNQQLLSINEKVEKAIGTIKFLNGNNRFNLKGNLKDLPVQFQPHLRQPERLLWFLEPSKSRNLDFGEKVALYPAEGLRKGHLLAKPESINIYILYPESLEQYTRSYMESLKREFDKFKIDLRRRWQVYNPQDSLAINQICQELTDADFVVAVVPKPENQDYDPEVNPYKRIKNKLIEKQLPSQMITYNTLKQQWNKYIGENLVLGINAKLGYMNWKLKEMPGNADAFIGLDVGRKNNRSVGASAFVLNSRGELIGWSNAELRAHQETFGREGLQNLLLNLFSLYQTEYQSPLQHLVVHRDGEVTKTEFEVFCELFALLQSKGLKTLDVVEILKSGTCRAVEVKANGNNTNYLNPDKGYGWEHCPNEAIVLTTGKRETKVSRNSSPRPLRIRKKMGDTDILTLAGQVYWLSEMQIGSTQTIRLPITTYYADRAAERLLEDLIPMGVSQDKRLWFL